MTPELEAGKSPVFLIVLLLLAGALTYLCWHLVHSAPWVLARVLPRGLTNFAGAFFLIIAFFCAYFAAQAMRDPLSMLQCFVQGFVGLWLMLATSATARGSYEDEQMLRRLFAMLGLVIVVIIGSLYVREPRLMATMNMALMAGGLWVIANYFQYLDRGR
jgi:hypothetical protein